MTQAMGLHETRKRLWYDHPIIAECAVLPTRPLQDVVARVVSKARKARSSIAFWADPETGKSFCIVVLERALKMRIPGCGVLVLEAVEDKQAAEGRLLLQILKAVGHAHPADRELAGKRDQVTRALLVLSGSARHLFMIIDEAQDFCNAEFAWLKAVINALARLGVKVTTVLFGQKELQQRREDLFNKGRSDLGVRFMKELHCFLGCRNLADLTQIMRALDRKSEYPEGSGWCFSEFLLPQAYAAGFRSETMAAVLWDAIDEVVPLPARKRGLPMEAVASTLAMLFINCRELDASNFSMSAEIAKEAVSMALR